VTASASGPARQTLSLTAIVLTKNERRNLPECLRSLQGWVQDVLVVDSFSTDETCAIAAAHGARVVQRAWRHHADQFQWALDHNSVHSEWIVRVDADERWTSEGFEQLAPLLERADLAGISVHRRIYFMGRFLRWGGLYESEQLRVFRRGRGHVEQRWMDEHIEVDGATLATDIYFLEANYDRQQNIGLWTAKHNDFSTREAVDILSARWKLAATESVADLRGGHTGRTRWLKENVYWRLPMLVRPLLYFCYRYLFKLGFLDGRPGLIFHLLQGFWYRLLVDVKVMQLEALARDSGRSLTAVIEDSYGIRIRVDSPPAGPKTTDIAA
jgi:glycosyltransferase involved in cell wall biosynthesis